MNKNHLQHLKLTYILLILVVFLLACNQTKFVPDGRYLLKKNEIVQTDSKLDKDDLNSIIRQQPNFKSFGIKWKLFAFNRVDSAKVADKRARKNIDLKAKNRELLKKQDRINAKRIDKAKAKGHSYYTHKTIQLKDTVEPRKFFREWYKYKIGRPPVVFDSIPFNKSIEQLNSYLKVKGYYYGNVQGFVDYKRNGKCVVKYAMEAGPRYFIDSVYYVVDNKEVEESYNALLKMQSDPPLLNEPFDSDMLDDYRDKVSRFMRDSSFYGFNSSHITFIADTNRANMKVSVGIVLGDKVTRSLEFKDSVIVEKQHKTKIREVYFHLADTIYYDGYTAEIDRLHLPKFRGQFLQTLDTLDYSSLNERRQRKEVNESIILYNGEMVIKPRVLEIYNYLDKNGPYRERFVESSYKGLIRLGLFTGIKTELKETDDPGYLEVHHYLAAGKKQSIGFEPRATNSNGFLGVSASMNYTNRNLFRGAERLTLSLSGGFESQPPIFDETIDGEKIKTAGRSFNTFEFGPSAKLEIPGFFPFRMSKMAKQRRPTTVTSAAYNYQNRADFTRGTFQMNFLWKFYISSTQIIQLGLPAASVVKFVNIDKSPEFENKLAVLNDVFLLDAYSNQFIWEDWKVTYEYNSKDRPNRRNNSLFYFNTTFDPAGNLLSAFSAIQDTTSSGKKAIAGLAYSQFLRLDNEIIYSKPLGKERSLNLKLLAGGGLPYGNSTNSLPYDYSFFAGGANDVRGWRARSLGPGSYKYYLDTNRTAVQLGDLRVGGLSEFRFSINSFFKGAVFVDAGNVWSVFYDENRPGSQISKNWYKEIAFATGFGLRMDLDYFVIRVDLGIPIKNPALPIGSQWIWQSRKNYLDEVEAFFGPDYYLYAPLPFIPQLHFGIGYPF